MASIAMLPHNNRLRRHVASALAGLTLTSPDPVVRIQAAQSVFKSREPAALPAVESALQKETNTSAKQAFAEAKAAIILAKADATDAEKLDAIAVVSGRGDQDVLSLLNDLQAGSSEQLMRVKASAIASIKNRLAIW